jgi:hypothetical protein
VRAWSPRCCWVLRRCSCNAGLPKYAVGAHLFNGLLSSAWGVTYWRDATEEVEFVVSQGTQDWTLKVKSGRGYKVSGVIAFR